MHSGHRKRLKARYLREGLDGFAPHEVLELLLTYAIPQKDVNPLAHDLIDHYGSLSAVLETSAEELKHFPGVGESTAVLLSMLPKLAGYYMRDRFRDRPVINTAVEAARYCQTLFFGLDYEAVYLLCLDAQGRLLHPALLQKGTIDESPVYARNVVETALRHKAYAVVLTHNHPGGGIVPSPADYQVTRMVVDALQTVDIRTIDHIIVAEGEYLSMAQQSILKRGLLIEAEEFETRVKSIEASLSRAASMKMSVKLEGYHAFQSDTGKEKKT